MSIKVKAVERNVSFDKSKEESYSHFHDGLALQGKGLGVAVFVDLCKRPPRLSCQTSVPI